MYILPPFYGIQTRDSEAKREETLKIKVYYIAVDVFCYNELAIQSYGNTGNPINPMSTLAFFAKLRSSKHDRGDI